jgi:hypothetical protein
VVPSNGMALIPSLLKLVSWFKYYVGDTTHPVMAW